MGYLRHGAWVDEWYDTAATGGRFVRQDARFRAWISPGGEFSPEPGRYHLYVSWACPWAHRTLIYRALKGLEDAIGVTVVDPLMLSDGWVIPAGADPVNHAQFLWQVYAKADPDYDGRATVPVLWDRRRETIVNNESGDIIRMLDAWPGARGPLLRPPELRRRDRCAQRRDLSRGQQRRLSRRLRDHAGRLRGGVSRVVRDARSAGSSACADSRSCSASGSPRRTGGCSPRWCASTPSTTATSSAIATAWWITRTCGTITRDALSDARASPRRCGSTTSSRTTTAATAPSIRPASSRPVRASILPRRPARGAVRKRLGG